MQSRVCVLCNGLRVRAAEAAKLSRLVVLALGLGVTVLTQASESISTWKVLAPPKPGSVQSYCENSADIVWQVALKGATIEVKGLTFEELYDVYFNSAARTPQFSFGKLRDFPRRFVEVDDGFVVGYNKGEWGGKLYWFARDGKSHNRISDHQVTEFVRHGTDLYAFAGLSHMGLDYGSMIKLERRNGRWEARTIAKLAGEPGPYIVDGSERVLIIAGGDKLVSVDFAGTQKVLHESAPGFGRASSIVQAPDGTIFVGAGRVVIRLVPQGSSFREQWLIPPEVASACKCRAVGVPAHREKEPWEPVRCD